MSNYNYCQSFAIELEKEINRDVVLFGLDGLSYFGVLQTIDDEDYAVLSPSPLALSQLVEILAPAEVVSQATFVYIPVSNIFAKGTNISADPFVTPPEEYEDLESPELAAAPQVAIADRQVHCDANSKLACQIGNAIALTTLGGFIFEGTLIAANSNRAIVSVSNIYAPGGDSDTLFGVATVSISLEAILAIASLPTL